MSLRYVPGNGITGPYSRFFFFFNYFWGPWVFIPVPGLSLAVARWWWGRFLVVGGGLLPVAASPLAEHRFSSCGTWA